MQKRSLRALTCSVLLIAVAFGAGCASSGSNPKAAGRPKRTVLLTSADDVRAGQEGAQSVQAEIGLLDDPALTAYVDRIGKKLLLGLPNRQFAFKFAIVDQMEPNAFALPGGYIYVSRGLLALANNEDELACVLGHEITHVARRHSAQQQAVAQQQSSFALPISRAATLASYGRDMEREADTIGQRLCAAAGYDPMAMSTFMRSLDQRERLLIGHPRAATFLDTHPGSRERAAEDAIRASELRWTRDPSLGDVRRRYLDRIDGMVIGDRPETGVFVGEIFMHPGLDFEITFPVGWRLQNSNRGVGAFAPRNEAVVYLTGDLPPGDIVKVADEFAAKAEQEAKIELTEKKHVRIGDISAVRYAFETRHGPPVSAMMTFFPFAGATWRMVGVTPRAEADRYSAPILLAMRSFVTLTDEHRALIRTNRLRVVLADSGEDFAALGARTGNQLSPGPTSLLNGFRGNEIFRGGEPIKIILTGSERTP